MASENCERDKLLLDNLLKHCFKDGNLLKKLLAGYSLNCHLLDTIYRILMSSSGATSLTQTGSGVSLVTRLQFSAALQVDWGILKIS